MLNQVGIRTFIVPEAATMLNKSGVSIANAKLDLQRVLKFQISLMKMQMSLEDIFNDIANDLYGNEKCVILCDRGVMDGSAYMTKSMWQALLDETGWSNSQLRDKRYDMVLHLVTAADGAREHYGTESNVSRYEDYEMAIKTDRKTQVGWIGHPSYSIIDNSTPGFNSKIKRCIERIYSQLGLPKATTFVKKFLLKKFDDGPYVGDAIVIFDMLDTYLIAKKGYTAEKVSRRVFFFS